MRRLWQQPDLWAFVIRLYRRTEQAELDLISAGVAFFGFLALFPATAALIAIWGTLFDPAVIQTQLELLKGFLPPDALSLVQEQVQSLLQMRGSQLGWTTALSTLFALWSARAGVAALIRGTMALPHAYGRLQFGADRRRGGFQFGQPGEQIAFEILDGGQIGIMQRQRLVHIHAAAAQLRLHRMAHPQRRCRGGLRQFIGHRRIQPRRQRMVIGQAIDVVLQCMGGRCRQYTGLAHAATGHLANPHCARDQRARAAQDRACGCSQPLAQAHRHAVEALRDARGIPVMIGLELLSEEPAPTDSNQSESNQGDVVPPVNG